MKAEKSLLIGILLCLFPLTSLFAQPTPALLKSTWRNYKNDSFRVERKKTAIYAEALSSSVYYSLHLNRVLFGSSRFFVDADAGVGFSVRADDAKFPVYSGAVSLNYGKNETFLFMGIGKMLGNLHTEVWAVDYKQANTFLILGAKHQPLNDNLYFRIFIAPHTIRYLTQTWYGAEVKQSAIAYTTGVSIGYIFNDKKRVFPTTFHEEKRLKNAIYLQLLGDGVVGIGYNRILFTQPRFFVDMRGLLGVSTSLMPTPWIGSSINFGKKKHYFETGLSYTWFLHYTSQRASWVDKYHCFMPVIGYKLIHKHFFMRVHFSPLLYTAYTPFVPLGGVSLGLAF
ncbi:MAG: hypothetical protein ACKVTZ_07290 [Bacteroidia bacterium]